MEKKKKVKPTRTKLAAIHKDMVMLYSEHSIYPTALRLSEVKKIHKWLGRAIEYLEGKDV